jgi:hypothetical protein
MNIILNLEQKVVEDIVYMIKGMPSQPSFLSDIESQLADQLVEPAAPAVEESPAVEEVSVEAP